VSVPVGRAVKPARLGFRLPDGFQRVIRYSKGNGARKPGFVCAVADCRCRLPKKGAS
jgi:hypothetical protein